MSSIALNAVYKTAVLAVEECAIMDVVTGATSLTLVATTYMVAAPFVVGKQYAIQDFGALSSGNPNSEMVTVTDISSVTSVADSSGMGYTIAGTLGISGNGTVAGTVNSYSSANNASILTPGMERLVQSADFNLRFKTLADAPKVDFDDESSRFASGDEGRDLSIAGARSGDIDITQKLACAGVDPTTNHVKVPIWSKIMRVMGHAVYRYIGTETIVGYGIQPHTWANEVTATIWVFNPENGTSPTSTVYRYCGAHGGNSCTIAAGKIGDPFMLTGKLSAAYVGTMELPVSQARVLTSPDMQIPEVMLNNLCSVPAVYGIITPNALTPLANCASFSTKAAALTALNLVNGSRFYTADGTDFQDGTLTTSKGSPLAPGDQFSYAEGGIAYIASPSKSVEISQFSLDFGGVVNPFIDQSTSTGNVYYATQDRDPKLTINPYHVKKTLDDIDSVVTNMITGPVVIQSQLTNPHITIEVANGQLMSPAIAAREGYLSTTRTYRALRNNLGGGASESALPDAAMYEILIGSRS